MTARRKRATTTFWRGGAEGWFFPSHSVVWRSSNFKPSNGKEIRYDMWQISFRSSWFRFTRFRDQQSFLGTEKVRVPLVDEVQSTKQRMIFRMIHVKDSLLTMGKVWSLDFLCTWFWCLFKHIIQNMIQTFIPVFLPNLFAKFCPSTYNDSHGFCRNTITLGSPATMPRTASQPPTFIIPDHSSRLKFRPFCGTLSSGDSWM